MFDGLYRKRLYNDLPQWRAKGWVTAEGEAAIAASVAESAAKGPGLAGVVAVLGAILMGFGVFAFISANWDYIPRFYRFGLLILGLFVCYGAAAALASRGLRWFSEAAVLFGCLLFGASIALVGQTYHLAGEFSSALMLWFVGVFAACVLTGSVAAIVLAQAVAAYWVYTVTGDNNIAPHWAGLAAVVATGAVAVWQDSRLARQAFIAGLAFWIVLTAIVLARRADMAPQGVFAALACVGLAFWSFGHVLSAQSASVRLRRLGEDFVAPALTSFLAAAAVLQLFMFEFSHSADARGWLFPAVAAYGITIALAGYAASRRALTAMDVIMPAFFGAAVIGLALWSEPPEFWGRLAAGIVVIGGALWWLWLAHRGHPIGSKFGLTIFGAEVLYLYAVTLGSLIDTALAFIAGGVLFTALAVLLFRLNRKLATVRPESVS